MKFDLLKKDPQTKARAGSITTDHGVIETPIFMPVGTVASVKGVHQRELKEEIKFLEYELGEVKPYKERFEALEKAQPPEYEKTMATLKK